MKGVKSDSDAKKLSKNDFDDLQRLLEDAY